MKKEIVTALAWAGGIIAVALAAAFARGQGTIGGDTATRVVMAMIGLMVVHFGNRLPKKVVPNAHGSTAVRIGGWALVLSGLIYAALWAFAPIPVATTVGTGAVAVAIIVSWSR